MRAERLAGGFFEHRGLIAFSVGGAVVETGLLIVLAPGARALGPQVTALPPLAAYHDLRWLFAFSQPWPAFAGLMLGLLIARAAADAALVLLAWPGEDVGRGLGRPRFTTAFLSCAVLTLLVWVLLAPVATLMFGVALVPFSWPYLGAVPILMGCALALSHGGVGRAWWRRLPGASTAGWLLAGFVVLSVVAAALPHLNTTEILLIAALAGVLNARAWYGVAQGVWGEGAHQLQGGSGGDRSPRGLLHWVPMAPVAAVLVVGLVVGLTRLTFTGTVHLAPGPGNYVAGDVGAVGAPGLPQGAPRGVWGEGSPQSQGGSGGDRSPRGKTAVLIISGFGSHCCNDADALRAAEPGMLVQQFSYVGLTAAGQPIAYRIAADLPIQVLGDRMAAQVEWLHARTHAPVNVVAESEGTLGLYAMMARHPGLPVGSLVLLSPIIGPGQVGQGGVPGVALTTLNSLIGTMSPYGSSGAQELIDSVSKFGASYFDDVRRERGYRWLSVIPLADAVTLPLCPYPPNVVVVKAFHGGLLGDAAVLRMVEDFLDGQRIVRSDLRLRTAAQVISAAASAWRMPDLHSTCRGA